MLDWLPQEDLGQLTGVVVPVYFSSKPDDATVEQLLWMTLCDLHLYVPLSQVCCIVDGDRRSEQILRQLQHRLARDSGQTFDVVPLSKNRGKLWAIQTGMRELLGQKPHLTYLAVIDGDADHMASVIPRLTRAAHFLRRIYGHSRLLVIGARQSRHRPMGWIRGELEAWLDQVTFDALAFRLAAKGRVLDRRHLTHIVPDFSSGFKVYGRELAQMLFQELEPAYLTLSPGDYWHYGPETVTVVEAVLREAVVAEIARPTWDGQPTTSFGEFAVQKLYGELFSWIMARLDIPVAVAAQLMDNCASRLTLRTMREGRALLEAVRRHALTKLGARQGIDLEQLPPEKPTLPFF